MLSVKSRASWPALRDQAQGLLALAAPMAVGAILEALVGFINITMLARLGPSTVAAASLVTTLFATLLMVFWGVFSSSSTLIAHRYGQSHSQAINELVVASCWLACLMGIAVGAVLWQADKLLLWWGQPLATIELARGYFHGLALAAIADFFTYALFSFLQGIMQSTITMVLSVLYVPINIAVNYLLMMGKWGLPALGAAGIGYGTAIAFWFLAVLCLVYIAANPKLHQYFKGSWWPSWSALRELLRVGIPLGLMWAVIFGFFFVISALMGKVSGTVLAAYQLVRQWVDIFFIIAYCLSKALGIKISEAIGQKQTMKLTELRLAALGLNGVFNVLVAMVLICGSHYLLVFDLGSQKTPEPTLLAYAETFFYWGAIYLAVNSFRTVYFGALLGLQDTLYLLLAATGCWLGIGVPVVLWVHQLLPGSTNALWGVMVVCELVASLVLSRRLTRLTQRL